MCTRSSSMHNFCVPMQNRFLGSGIDPDGLKVVFCNNFIGFGVFAMKDIMKGQFILEYAGERIFEEEAVKREENYRKKGKGCFIYFNILSADKTQKFCIDATHSKQAGRFVNDAPRRNANAAMKRIIFDGKAFLALFALQDIKKGTELRYDYGDQPSKMPWRLKKENNSPLNLNEKENGSNCIDEVIPLKEVENYENTISDALQEMSTRVTVAKMAKIEKISATKETFCKEPIVVIEKMDDTFNPTHSNQIECHAKNEGEKQRYLLEKKNRQHDSETEENDGNGNNMTEDESVNEGEKKKNVCQIGVAVEKTVKNGKNEVDGGKIERLKKREIEANANKNDVAVKESINEREMVNKRTESNVVEDKIMKEKQIGNDANESDVAVKGSINEREMVNKRNESNVVEDKIMKEKKIGNDANESDIAVKGSINEREKEMERNEEDKKILDEREKVRNERKTKGKEKYNIRIVKRGGKSEIQFQMPECKERASRKIKKREVEDVNIDDDEVSTEEEDDEIHDPNFIPDYKKPEKKKSNPDEKLEEAIRKMTI